MAFFLEELKLEGIDVVQILSCQIDCQIGQHGTLTMTAYIEDFEQLVFHRSAREKIHLYLQKPGKEKRYSLFYGVITHTEITNTGELTVLSFQAKTLSYLMDIQKRSRSFQNKELSYAEIIKQIFADYEGADFQFWGEDRPIGDWLIQYQETDWQFLQRILSHLGIQLTPAADYHSLAVFAGIPEREEDQIPYQVLTMSKALHSYYYAKANGQQAYPANYTRYRITSAVQKVLFDLLTIKNTDFLISECCYHFYQGQLSCQYLLQKTESIRLTPKYPLHLTGVALQGEIIGVDGDLVQVQLDIDEGRETKNPYWIPYSTVSAAPDGTGWYYMPELGDQVKVYFPSKDLSQAIALNAVNQYQQPAAGEDHMADVKRVYLSTAHDKKLILDEDKIKIASNGDAASVELLTDGTVILNASNDLQILAESQISLSAGQTIEWTGKEGVAVMDQSTAASLTINEEGAILLTGAEIFVN